jgi:hypothetical protein
MNHKLYSALLAAALTAGPFLVGCEETVSKETQTKVKDDGTVIKKQEKVTEGADGTVTKTESRSVDKPDNDRDGASIKVDVDKKD